MTQVTIGNVTILPLLDTSLLMNPRMFFPEHAEQAIAEYPDLLDERQLMQVSITCYLVRSAGRNVLIDTGLGPRRRPNFPPGKLDQAFANANIDPASIDQVVHTHLHIDHVGWNTVEDGAGGTRAYFPNARHIVQQREWDYWMQPKFVESQDHLRECVEPLAKDGRFDFYEGEHALDENLTFVPAPGHTPGHVAIGIYSAGERAVIIGDASHHPMQLDHPDWSPSADVDPVLSASSRDSLMDTAADDGRTWIAGHWPHPGVGRIVRLDGKRVFKAL